MAYSAAIYTYGANVNLKESLMILFAFDYLYGMAGYILRNALHFNKISISNALILMILIAAASFFAARYFVNDINSLIMLSIGLLIFPLYIMVAAIIEKQSATAFSVCETIGASTGALCGVCILFIEVNKELGEFSLAYRPLLASLIMTASGIYYIYKYVDQPKLMIKTFERFNKQEVARSFSLSGLIYISSVMFFRYSVFTEIFINVANESKNNLSRLYASIYDPLASFFGLILRYSILETKGSPNRYLNFKFVLLSSFNTISLLIFLFGSYWMPMAYVTVVSLATIFLVLVAFQATLIFCSKLIEMCLSAALILISVSLSTIGQPVVVALTFGVIVTALIRYIAYQTVDKG